jgi:hypothetical protein
MIGFKRRDIVAKNADVQCLSSGFLEKIFSPRGVTHRRVDCMSLLCESDRAQLSEAGWATTSGNEYYAQITLPALTIAKLKQVVEGESSPNSAIF